LCPGAKEGGQAHGGRGALSPDFTKSGISFEKEGETSRGTHGEIVRKKRDKGRPFNLLRQTNPWRGMTPDRLVFCGDGNGRTIRWVCRAKLVSPLPTPSKVLCHPQRRR